VKLSSQALEVLKILREEGPLTVADYEDRGLDQSMVNRAALELEEEGLIELGEDEELEYVLTEKGLEVKEKGSPEYRLVQRVSEDSVEISELEDIPKDIAIGKARERGWIEIKEGEVYITSEGEEVDEDPVKKKLEDEDFTDEHEDRGLAEPDSSTERRLSLTEDGEGLNLEDVELDFNVEARTATPRTGKKHYYKNILQYARQTWIELGFQEMEGDYVVPSFLNFDALYTPQDHPARELHDTFFVENPETSDLSEYGDKVEHVKETHENGWSTGSRGYGGDWSREEAERNVVRTHTTAISAQQLHKIDINEEELPKKFFIVGRNFRNETVDRTHLAEFYQTDGIVVGKDLNFANLKGYISKFFEKMGYDKFRLIPSYYPYTEMSVEVQVWDEEDEEWLGMGGAGMFRPEVVKPMLGFEAKVLAWGLGIPRIAFMAAGLSDIRELYRNDIKIINDTPVWRPDWNTNRGEQ
jgi:phenylalanyl-tRNA synthetase alpha chain